MRQPTQKPAASRTRSAAPVPVAIGTRLRHARRAKGLLFKEPTERVGVSINTISKHGNDKVLPSLTVLHRRVAELETNVGALFEPGWSEAGHVSRVGGRRLRVAAARGSELARVELERLQPGGQIHLLQGNIHVVVQGDGIMGLMRHHGDEVGDALEGRLKPGIADTTYELGPDDSFSFPAHLPHRYKNAGIDVSRAIRMTRLPPSGPASVAAAARPWHMAC